MKDNRIEKIRAKIERLKSNLIHGACASQIAMETRCKEDAYNEVLAILDTMQEEPVSEKKCIFTKDHYTDEDRKILCENCEEDCEFNKKEKPVTDIDFEQELYKYFGQVKDFTLGMRIAKRFYEMGRNHQEPVSEDLEKIVEEIAEPTILNAYGTNELARRLRSTICGTSVSEDLEEASLEYFKQALKDGDKTKLDAFKAGAKWQKEKDESTTEDLGEYINELSKQFPEVSFAKLSRIAVRSAKWQREQTISKACEWIKKNVTFTHPRKGTKECIVNLSKFKEAMMED